MKKREIKEENQEKQDKINNIRKKLGVIYYLLAILAGPIEILVVYLLYGKRDDVNILFFIGFLIISTIVFRIILFILKTIIYKITKYEYDTPAVIILISYIVSYFVSILLAGESVGTAIVLCICILCLKVFFVILGSDSGNASTSVPTTSTQNNKKGFNFKTVHYTDQFGNYKGSATTYDFGHGLKTTEFKDSAGNYKGGVSSYNFHDDDN